MVGREYRLRRYMGQLGSTPSRGNRVLDNEDLRSEASIVPIVRSLQRLTTNLNEPGLHAVSSG